VQWPQKHCLDEVVWQILTDGVLKIWLLPAGAGSRRMILISGAALGTPSQNSISNVN
jgi:hypothetical protein